MHLGLCSSRALFEVGVVGVPLIVPPSNADERVVPLKNNESMIVVENDNIVCLGFSFRNVRSINADKEEVIVWGACFDVFSCLFYVMILGIQNFVR